MIEIPRKWKESTIVGLSVLLAVTLFATALFQLIFLPSTVDQFRRFGYEPWFVCVAVLVELSAGALIAIPVTRPHGASLIILTMIAAMLSYLKAEQPGRMIAPLVVLILASVIAWLGPSKPSRGGDDEAAEQQGASRSAQQKV